jgi:hypothetical protein
MSREKRRLRIFQKKVRKERERKEERKQVPAACRRLYSETESECVVGCCAVQSGSSLQTSQRCSLNQLLGLALSTTACPVQRKPSLGSLCASCLIYFRTVDYGFLGCDAVHCFRWSPSIPKINSFLRDTCNHVHAYRRGNTTRKTTVDVFTSVRTSDLRQFTVCFRITNPLYTFDGPPVQSTGSTQCLFLHRKTQSVYKSRGIRNRHSSERPYTTSYLTRPLAAYK